MAWIGNIIKRSILSLEQSPDKVLEVKSAKYSDLPIVCREECIVLYGGQEKYEVVMQRPCTESVSLVFSLYRSSDKKEAEVRFHAFKDKIPFLCKTCNSNLNMIQKYCLTLQDHPSWNIAHMIVYYNLTDLLQSPEFLNHINTPDSKFGVSPLQIAVQEGNLLMVNKLVQMNADINHFDKEGNSVYHYAASTTKEIILALRNDETKSLNKKNLGGQTPLHVACMADKPECVTALLISGADVNLSASPNTSIRSTTAPGLVGDFMADYPTKLHQQEMKFGGTPLHWSSSREVINALLDRNCDIDAFNFDSRTALHIMVLRDRLECVVALLSREADMNIGDGEGNTPLHLAVKARNIPITQALIVFGAELSLLNNAGYSVRHVAASNDNGNPETTGKILYILHSIGAPRCHSSQVGCTPGCSFKDTYDGIPPPPPPSPQPRVIASLLEEHTLSTPLKDTRGGRLLCLDGGGIRGLILVTLLLHLENAVGKPIIHCFDWLAATSTGAILALALAAGKSLKECLCVYFRMKDETFSGFRPYSSEPLEAMLKENLGTDTTMADIKHPKLMITGCLADRKPVDLHFFRNYECASDLLGPSPKVTEPHLPPTTPFRDQLIWEAARASGAAPSYFRAFGRFVDGGLIANNPTLDAITEIHEYNTALKQVGRGEEAVNPTVVVSIGTGSVPVTLVESMDIFWPSGFWDTAKLVSGVKSMQAVLVDQATLADGRVVDRTRAVCSMLSIPYFRFSPQLSEDIAMDEKSDAKLVNMLWETKAFIYSNHEMVIKLATLLNL